ncbi:hypothetical protein [Streptomyces sp. NPDC001340]
MLSETPAAVQGTPATAVFSREREIDQRPHQPVRTQQRVASLGQRVAPRS